jgi:hypothetical protein
MRPARIPCSPRIPIGWAVGGLLAMAALACSSSDPGPQGITEGSALGKFCHELNRGGQPVTLTLQLGDPAIISITAKTGVCAPMAGTPCAMIPVGKVPVKLMEGDRVLTTRSVILTLPEPGMPLNEYVFQPVITNNLQVAITGGRIASGTCQSLDFPAPDGGVRDGGEAGASDGGTAGEVGAVDAGADAPPPPADVAAPADAGVDAAPPADVAADTAAADTAPADGLDDSADAVTD